MIYMFVFVGAHTPKRGTVVCGRHLRVVSKLNGRRLVVAGGAGGGRCRCGLAMPSDGQTFCSVAAMSFSCYLGTLVVDSGKG